MRTNESNDRHGHGRTSTWNRVEDTATLWSELELTVGTRNALEIVHRLRLLRAAAGQVATAEGGDR